MAIKSTKSVVDSDLRLRVFTWLMGDPETDEVEYEHEITNSMRKINDRQYGCILTDLNGVERYVRIGAIVAEEREDMTARELMQKEMNEYNAKQAKKAEVAKANKEKAERDKAAREAKKKEKEKA